MELFKLFGTIAVDNAQANADIDATTKRAESASGKFGSAMGKVGKFAVSGAGAAVGAFAGMAASLVGLVESQQQNIENMGKLETSFKQAGLSAEQAQSTYSGFMGLLGDADQANEASLLMGNLAEAGGDIDTWYQIAAGTMAEFGDALPTETLIESANETARTGKVVGTMADALNWSGTSADTFSKALEGNSEAQAAFNAAIAEGLPIEDAMNAALATSNSTTERQAMLQSALAAAYQETGQEYVKNNENLVAYREAQADLNTALASAAEALMPLVTTFMEFGVLLMDTLMPAVQMVGEGLRGMFQGTEEGQATFIEGITTLFDTVFLKIAEILPQMLTVGLQIIQGLLNGIMAALPTLVEGLAVMLPQLLEIFLQMITQLVTQLILMLPTLIPMIIEAIIGLINTIVMQLPIIIQTVLPAIVQALLGIVNALPQILPNLINAVTSMIQQVAAMLPTLIPVIIQAAVQLFMGIVHALPQIIAALIPAVQNLITTAINLLPTFLPMMLQAAVQLFTAVVQALPQILPQLIEAVTSFITSAVELLPTFLPQLLEAGVQLFLGIVQAIPKILPELFSAIVELIAQLPGKILESLPLIVQAGFDLIMGLVTGFMDSVGSILETIGNICGDILDGILGFFGINSPSRVMRYYMKFVPEGMALGIEDEADVAVKAVADTSEAMLDAAEIEDMQMGVSVARSTAPMAAQDGPTAEEAAASAAQGMRDEVVAALDYWFGLVLGAMPREVRMDTGQLVGALAPAMDARLGVVKARKGRGN